MRVHGGIRLVEGVQRGAKALLVDEGCRGESEVFPLLEGGAGGELTSPSGSKGCRGARERPCSMGVQGESEVSPCSMGCRGERSLPGEWRSGDTVLMTGDGPAHHGVSGHEPRHPSRGIQQGGCA